MAKVYRVFSEEELHVLKDELAWLKAASAALGSGTTRSTPFTTTYRPPVVVSPDTFNARATKMSMIGFDYASTASRGETRFIYA